MRVALATCRQLPEPDPDADLLLEELRARDLDATFAGWDDPAVDWSRFELCVLRSTWNYHRHPAAFLQWIERVSRVCALANAAPVVRWNSHKRYLADLERAGVPVAPTVWLPRGTRGDLAALAAARGWDEVVVKPSVSAGSFETMRVGRGELARGDEHLRDLLAERDAMVQRYLPSVEGHGERALVYIAGAFTHAVRKSPRFGDDAESVSQALPIAADELAFAQRVLAAIPIKDPLLYGRVDVVRGEDGRLCLMELELIEPSLFLQQSSIALARFADAIAALGAKVPA